VYRNAEEIVKEGEARGILKLGGFEGMVEVGDRKHVVKVTEGGAEFDVGRGGKKLLRIKITAEVDGVKSDYVMTYSRYGEDNAVAGFAYARADAPGGREADAERFSALIKALTGEEPRVHRNEGRRDNDRVRQGASRRLQALHRTRRHHREVTRGEYVKFL